MLRAGELRHRVNVQELRKLQGTGADREESWTTKAPKIPASINALSGREFQWAREMFATSTHAVVIRYMPGLSVKDRFKLGDRIFNITHIDNVGERNIELRCICVEELK